jgi:hypothetical protein
MAVIAAILATNYGNITEIEKINISESHDSATTIANITIPSDAYIDYLNLNDSVSIYLGYEGQTELVFTGFIKRIDKEFPDGRTVISCQDILSRASEYLMVNPGGADEPYTWENEDIEDVIADILQMAGITNFYLPVPTSFTIATGGTKLEINLQIAYDAIKQLTDIIAWDIWSDKTGVIWLKNRKPYPMYGTSGQPGDSEPEHADVPIRDDTDPIDVDEILSLSLAKSDRDLRNKIVVYGAKSLTAVAQSSTSYDPVEDDFIAILPAAFFKAAVLSSNIISDQSFADDACSYNLALLNRVQYEISTSVVGNPLYHARETVHIEYDPFNIHGQWYIYQCDHNFGKEGYTCDLVLRK